MSNNPSVGILKFDYPKSPYTYVNVLDGTYSDYRYTNNIFASGTKDVIGTINVFTTISYINGIYYGEVVHQYILPQGIIRAVYLTQNMTSGGAFAANNVFKTTVDSGSSGNFLGSIGTITATVDSTPIRHVEIDFYKANIYPLGA